MKNLIRTLAICALLPVHAFAADFCFAVHTDRNDQTKKAKTETVYDSKIKLSDSRLAAEREDVETIYDFKNDMATDIYPKKKIYRSMPIVADVAFRVYEAQNREFINKAIVTSGAQNVPVSSDPVFDAGHDLGIIVPGHEAASLTSDKNKDGSVSVLKGADKIADFKYSSTAVPKDLQDEYRKIWIYLWPVYPKLADSVVAEEKLPQTFETNYSIFSKSGGADNLKLKFQPLKDCSSFSEHSTKELTKVYAPDPVLNTLIMAGRDVAKRTTVDQYKKEIQDLIDKKKYYEAYVVMNAQVLEYGNAIDKTQADAISPHLKEDIRSMVFIQAGSAVPKDKIDLVVKNLDTEAHTKMARSYIFDVYAANVLIQKDPEAARARMLKALAKYPFATGAWKDLGDMYVKAFETPNGWASYDMAKLLNPDFPTLAKLAPFEKKFKTDFPEFF